MLVQACRAYHRLPASKLLPRLQKMVAEARETTSVKQKMAILGQYTDLHPFLVSLYKSGPINLTSKALDRCTIPGDTQSGSYVFIEDFLEDLSKRSISGNNAVIAAQKLASEHNQFADLIGCIIDKDLRIRMGQKLVLRSIGVASDDLPVALAEDFSDEKSRQYFKDNIGRGDPWFVSRKLDGIRCLAFCHHENGNWKVELKSRQGKPLVLPLIEKSITDSLKPNTPLSAIVLDGELCCFLDGMDSKEDFRAAASITSADNGDVSKVDFVVFDVLSIDEFQGKLSTPFSERIERCFEIIQCGEHLKALPQSLINTVQELDQHVTRWHEAGWEGVMLRRASSPYTGKRSKDLLKFKDRQDAEFTVTGYNLAPIRFIEKGEEMEEIMLSSIRIEYKGRPVDVGSGFTMAERRKLRELGDDLIGRRVTVSYYSESFRKGGDGERPSLRFPSFKCFRDDK